jgi:hypothetical protein
VDKSARNPGAEFNRLLNTPHQLIWNTTFCSWQIQHCSTQREELLGDIMIEQLRTFVRISFVTTAETRQKKTYENSLLQVLRVHHIGYIARVLLFARLLHPGDIMFKNINSEADDSPVEVARCEIEPCKNLLQLIWFMLAESRNKSEVVTDRCSRRKWPR